MFEIGTRNHSIDRLKIAAMFFIILGHFLIFRQDGLEKFSLNAAPAATRGDYTGLVLLGFAIIGTNLFFLITGYFGSKLKPAKLLDLILVMYLWGGLVQAILLAARRITLSTMLHTLLLLPDRYWFMEVYLVLMLATPVLNAFLARAGLKQKLFLLGAWFLILCVYSFTHDCTRIGAANGFSFIWAAFLYAAGNALREVSEKRKKDHRSAALAVYAASTILYIAVCIALAAGGKHGKLWKFAVSYNNPLVLASAVSFFWLFACRKEVRENRAVTLLAGATLGVYLIHTAPNLNLFSRIALRTDTVKGCLVLAGAAVLGSAAIYLVCATLDLLRQKTVSPPVLRLLKKATERLETRWGLKK